MDYLAIAVLAQEAEEQKNILLPAVGELIAGTLGFLVGKTVEGISRKPEAAGQVRTLMFIGLALVEALALFGFALAFVVT